MMEAPGECVEAKGIEDFVLLPVGGTLWAIDPDVILIAVGLGQFAE
jgi:hypothetical protein